MINSGQVAQMRDHGQDSCSLQSKLASAFLLMGELLAAVSQISE